MIRAYDLVRRDAARWVRPEQVADLSEVTLARLAALLYRHPSLRATAWFRIASWARERRVPGLPGLIQRRVMRHYGLELVPGARVGGGLYIAHPVGCTLVAESIGENVSIMASVTIGRLTTEVWPTIGDRAFVGAGARLLGPIHIGSDAVIGANAVVLDDVPAGRTAVGIPARLVAAKQER